MKETICWKRGLPDSDITVLIFSPDGEQHVWLGFYDGKCWWRLCGLTQAAERVTHWAEIPIGPALEVAIPRWCACGCGQEVFGKQKTATAACRKRL